MILKLKELMQISFNAGRESAKTPDDEGWRPFWEDYGEDRHDAYRGQALIPVCSEHALEDSDPIICEEGGIGACERPAGYWGKPDDSEEAPEEGASEEGGDSPTPD